MTPFAKITAAAICLIGSLLLSQFPNPVFFPIYVVFVGGVQAVLIGVVVVALGVVRMFSQFGFERAAAKVALFNAWLLLFGVMGHGAWMFFVDGKLYANPDAFVQFVPFAIPGNWTIDPACHGHLETGVRWRHMYAAWACIALPVWALTVLAYRRSASVIFRERTPTSLVPEDHA